MLKQIETYLPEKDERTDSKVDKAVDCLRQLIEELRFELNVIEKRLEELEQ